MSLFQTFRDGINPAWKEIWRDIVSIAFTIVRIVTIIIMCVEYSHGNFPKATFFAVLVVWMTVSERPTHKAAP